MTRPRSVLVWAVAAMILGSSCAPEGRSPDRPSAARPAVAVTVASAAPEAAVAAPIEASPGTVELPKAAAEQASQSAAAPAPSEAAAATGSVEEPEAVATSLEVAATTSPTCVLVGGAVEVAIVTEPGATLGLAAMYADHDAHGAMGFGEADAGGRYVWRLVVPADAPSGQAVAVIGADRTGPDGTRRTGHVLAPFTVAEVAGCR